MNTLKGSQRKHLRGLAHSFKPVVQIGKEGLTDAVAAAIDDAITARELIKVRISGEREDREALVPIIEERIQCQCVGTIGRMAILYRQHPDPDRRRIELPD
ncbi:MAG: YhbY family RNA-binding protein [Thermoanaerobaculales bacterium]|jgi:RNA-binding protein|nr:YhbY family RNA-binding protein [Thermoanaerobaculales bacterium]